MQKRYRKTKSWISLICIIGIFLLVSSGPLTSAEYQAVFKNEWPNKNTLPSSLLEFPSHEYNSHSLQPTNQTPPPEHALGVLSVEPKVLKIGENNTVRVVFENAGNTEIRQAIVTLKTMLQFTIAGSAQKILGDMKPGERKEVQWDIYIDLPTKIYSPEYVPYKTYSAMLTLNMTYKQRFKYYQYELMPGGIMITGSPEIKLSGLKAEVEDGFIKISGEVSNTGVGEAIGLSLIVLGGERHGSDSWVTGDLEPNDFDNFEISVPFYSYPAPKKLNLTLSISYREGGGLGKEQLTFSKEVFVKQAEGSPLGLIVLIVVIAIVALLLLLFFFWPRKKKKKKPG